MKKILYLAMALLVSSCSSAGLEQQEKDYVELTATASDLTKTQLGAMGLSFSAGDEILVKAYAHDGGAMLNTINLSNTEADLSSFSGQMFMHRHEDQQADYYAFYPSSVNVSSNGLVSAVAPRRQAAPFDPASTVMMAATSALYSETDVPTLNLAFGQLLAPLRIEVSCSDPSHSDDMLSSITISANEQFCGAFTFSLTDPQTLDFTGGDRSMNAVFTGGVSLGSKVSTTVMIRPGVLTGAKIVCKTSGGNYTFEAKSSIEIKHGKVNVISLDTSDAVQTHPRKNIDKRIICYGDSFTNRGSRSIWDTQDVWNECNYPTQLRELLGPDWEVVNRGNTSMTSDSILQLVLDNKLSAGLVIFYMGRNDAYQRPQMSTYNALYANYQKAISAMIPDSSGNTEYLVLGQHNCQYWEAPVTVTSDKVIDYRVATDGTSYRETIAQPFIEENRFVELYYPVVNNWEEMLVRTGVYPDKSKIDRAVEFPGSGTGPDGAVMVDSDGDGVKDKALDWPQSFWYLNSLLEREYVHPSKYGAKAIALLIVEKMREMGYLDE